MWVAGFGAWWSSCSVEVVVLVSEKALDDFEVAARARVDELEGELDRVTLELAGARDVLSRVEVTRVTLAAVAASRPGVAVVAGGCVGVVVDRSVRLPVWGPGLGGDALPAHYRALFAFVVGAGEPVRCQVVARGLGFGPSPSRVEAVRSKLKRLVERGWVVESVPGLFAVRA